MLGFAGTDNTGLSGLEFELNKWLTGKPGSATEVRDALGQAVNTIQQRPAHPGRDVFLTLDSHIQANAEQVLTQTVQEWHAKDATAIVIDPRTGAILAMAQEPGYNANYYPAATKHDLTIDHAVNDVFEPGSVFKVVTIGGALSQHDITPNTAFQVPGSLHVADRVIHDAEPHGPETLKVKQILQRSSNIGTDMIAERYLGESGLKKWMARFGFGRRTGIDFPRESPGLLPSYWSGSTIGTVPIGQGVSVTAIQLASAYAAIANGGEWIQPHLVDHVAGQVPVKPKRRRILSRGVDTQLRTMLRGVVSDQGTAELAAIPGYAVAGKTGTAQKPGPNGYIPGAYVATFVGMVPASRPRLLVLVTIDEPHGQIYGGLVAAPAFEQIASFDLQYLEVPPTCGSSSRIPPGYTRGRNGSRAPRRSARAGGGARGPFGRGARSRLRRTCRWPRRALLRGAGRARRRPRLRAGGGGARGGGARRRAPARTAGAAGRRAGRARGDGSRCGRVLR